MPTRTAADQMTNGYAQGRNLQGLETACRRNMCEVRKALSPIARPSRSPLSTGHKLLLSSRITLLAHATQAVRSTMSHCKLRNESAPFPNVTDVASSSWMKVSREADNVIGNWASTPTPRAPMFRVATFQTLRRTQQPTSARGSRGVRQFVLEVL